MKKLSLHKTLILIVAVFVTQSGFAQLRNQNIKNGINSNVLSDLFLNLKGGSAISYGSYSPTIMEAAYKTQNEQNFTYGLSVGKWITPYLAASVNFQAGKFHTLNSSFEISSIFNEYTAQVSLNILDLIDPNPSSQHTFYPYVFFGYGLIDFRSAFYTASNQTLVEYGTDKMVTEWVLPMGFGIAYNCRDQFTFSFDANYHYINTDRLDSYINNAHDSMLFLSANIIFHFNSQLSKRKNKQSLNWTRF